MPPKKRQYLTYKAHYTKVHLNNKGRAVRRSNETAEDTEKRLADQRVRSAKRRSNETAEDTDECLCECLSVCLYSIRCYSSRVMGAKLIDLHRAPPGEGFREKTNSLRRHRTSVRV